MYDEFTVSAIEPQPDGSFIVTVTHRAAEDWLLKGYILGFGALAEVLEPQYLRELIAAEAQKINNMTWDGMI